MSKIHVLIVLLAMIWQCLSLKTSHAGSRLRPVRMKNRFCLSARMISMNMDHSKVYPPIKTKDSALDDYNEMYKESIQSPDTFWDKQAKNLLKWFTPYSTVMEGSLEKGDHHWFNGGQLNACFNCIDRYAHETPDKTAIIWESDEPGSGRKISYRELMQEVSRIANVMKAQGVKKGDIVTIYMPMIPELAMTMLACSRIGAVHSVVFAGFSADALRDRIKDCKSQYLFVSDEGKRGGKTTKIKATADAALAGGDVDVKSVMVFKYTGTAVSMTPGRDVWMHNLLPKARPYCPPEPVASEDPLFILYTSGSTGKPKGIVHTTAGYLLSAALTTKQTFDLQPNDVYCCVADCGWITGHTYIVYGPLLNGATTVIFESIPTYPNPYRYWDIVQRYKVNQFYTAPTALRALMRFDAKPIESYDLSSLRVLGSVGEPINPQAWEWYNTNIGRGKCSIVDTYWQTETGSHVATSLPGVHAMKPGSCGRPLYGMDLVVLDSLTGKEIDPTGKDEIEGLLCVKSLWPSIARTLQGDHERFMNVYLKPYPGYYFTGDACRRDKDGFYWITGRVDDVINPSGHRIGTAEIEAALSTCDEVSEAAVVGFPHDVKGEGICCYVIVKEGVVATDVLESKLVGAVRKIIGPIATPDIIVFSDLPKTRSGKIMRRILRKVAAGSSSPEELGDTSTLADPNVVGALIKNFADAKNNANKPKVSS